MAGRPSVYQPNFAEQAAHLCELGATDYQLAKFFKVTTRTIERWKIKHEEFCRALKVGKDVSDESVARSLYHRAMGYTFETEEIFQYQGEVVRTKVVKHIPPDTTAMIFWLKNRRPDAWRDKVDILSDGKQINAIPVINVMVKPPSDGSATNS